MTTHQPEKMCGTTRVAASDVDFRFSPDGNSGAFDCYAAPL